MKKVKWIILLVLLVLLKSHKESVGQCTNTSRYPSATVSAPTTATPVTIATNSYGGEYCEVSGIISGKQYQSTYSLSGGYITVRSGTSGGTLVASGYSPLTWTAAVSGSHFIHFNTNSSCGTNSTNSTTTISCLNCNATVPSLTVSSFTVNENAGTAVFTISLSSTSTSAVTGNYATSAVTASAGTDFTAVSSSFNIQAGYSSTTVSVPIIDDTAVESTETFNLVISNPANATIATGTGVCTINDNDVALPSLSVNSITVNENAGTAVFTISLSSTYTSAVTGNYATSAVTASAGTDFTAVSSSFNIQAGYSSTTVSVPIIDNTTVESTETFNLVISNPANATIATGTGVCTITDNDGSGAVTSVGLSMPGIFTVSGSPVTTSGTLAVTLNSQAANLVFASPNGSTGSPSFRALSVSDIPVLDASKVTTGVFSTARLGSGTASSSTYLRGDGAWATVSGGSSQWNTSGSNIYYTSGGVSIGTSTMPAGYKLAVAGKIITDEVMVKTVGTWPDYVFDKNYNLRSLEELQNCIEINKHLPGIPSAQEMEEKGIGLSEMNMLLLKKIEELTLYILKQNEENEYQKNEIEALKKRILVIETKNN